MQNSIIKTDIRLENALLIFAVAKHIIFKLKVNGILIVDFIFL